MSKSHTKYQIIWTSRSREKCDQIFFVNEQTRWLQYIPSYEWEWGYKNTIMQLKFNKQTFGMHCNGNNLQNNMKTEKKTFNLSHSFGHDLMSAIMVALIRPTFENSENRLRIATSILSINDLLAASNSLMFPVKSCNIHSVLLILLKFGPSLLKQKQFYLIDQYFCLL